MDGKGDRECAALIEFRRYGHRTAQSAHKRADMGEADTLTGFVLGSGAAEQVENALVILGSDATAVIGDFKNGKTKLGPAADSNLARNSRLHIFDRVVDQIGVDLL